MTPYTGGYDAVSYTYNAIGNITSRTVGAKTYAYAYDPEHKHAVKTITVDGTPYTFNYDANGNMVYGPDFTDPNQVGTRWPITYNADNMPIQVVHTKGGNTVTTDFLYDGQGVRAKKAVQGGSTTYYIGEHYEVKDATVTKFIFAGNLRIAKVTASGRWYFHKDHLGSSTAITGEDGITVVESTEYMPFGGIRVHTGSVVSDYKYTDQEQDSETGLYNYRARLYDPIIGRFISADIIVQNFSDPQALNRYAYARNNPLIYSDPSGQFFGIDDLFRVVVGAIFGGVKALIEGKDVTQGMAAGAVSGLTFGIAGGIIRFAEITDPIIQSAIYAGTFAASKQISEAIVGSNGTNAGTEQISLSTKSDSQTSSTLSFESLWKNHPANRGLLSPCADEKGQPYFVDQCAIRMGECLRVSGVDLSSFGGMRCSPGYSRYIKHRPGHILRAEELVDWMRDRKSVFGDVRVYAGVSHESFAGRRGIVFFRNLRIGSYRGYHIDLWNRDRMALGRKDYFVNSKEVWFWDIE